VVQEAGVAAAATGAVADKINPEEFKVEKAGKKK
jgi:hypothetical protein